MTPHHYPQITQITQTGYGFGFWVLGFGFWVLGFAFCVLRFAFWVFGLWALGLTFAAFLLRGNYKASETKT
jgi:hypothetical protein